jgi:ketosteroid isomerase-like protein
MRQFHVLLLMFCTVLWAATATAADSREVEVKKARVEFWKYWDTRDATGMATMLTDDFVQFTRNARFADKTTFLSGLKAGNYSQTANRNLDDVVDPRVRFYGTVAIVTYSLHLEADAAGSVDAATPRPRITEVWAKVEGKGWKMVNFHASLPLSAPVAPAAK